MTAIPEPRVRRYSAAAVEHGFWQRVLQPMLGYPVLMVQHRYLLQNFFRRELLGRFRGSALGMFWVLIQPLFQFCIYFLVFGYLFGRSGVAPSTDFALYLFTGIIAYNALAEGCMRSCSSVVENGNLVKKVAFPSELLPVHSVLVAQTVYLVGALVGLVLGLCNHVLHPDWTLLLLPVVMLVQTVFTIGLGLLLANLNVFARDVQQLWAIISMAWMFLTPVFWLPNQLKDHLGGWLQAILSFNPAYPLLQAHRIVLGARDMQINETTVQFGNLWLHLLVASGWALFFMALGLALFRSKKHKYADLV